MKDKGVEEEGGNNIQFYSKQPNTLIRNIWIT